MPFEVILQVLQVCRNVEMASCDYDKSVYFLYSDHNARRTQSLKAVSNSARNYRTDLPLTKTINV